MKGAEEHTINSRHVWYVSNMLQLKYEPTYFFACPNRQLLGIPTENMQTSYWTDSGSQEELSRCVVVQQQNNMLVGSFAQILDLQG